MYYFSVNGKRYCVRDRHKLHEQDKLAATADNMQILVDYVANKYPDRNNCIRLKKILTLKQYKKHYLL